MIPFLPIVVIGMLTFAAFILVVVARTGSGDEPVDPHGLMAVIILFAILLFLVIAG
ncbi:hypothetical protein [Bifidobacterium rousetti]|uniref:hypothetical protein n=1 Tax=Bifidobacterium rousetti TaxID=2045439 RepID=UPI00168AC173|nr:hypothetical protein [Bifidobacterium rousetti]